MSPTIPHHDSNDIPHSMFNRTLFHGRHPNSGAADPKKMSELGLEAKIGYAVRDYLLVGDRGIMANDHHIRQDGLSGQDVDTRVSSWSA
jgi:hypothetical protein